MRKAIRKRDVRVYSRHAKHERGHETGAMCPHRTAHGGKRSHHLVVDPVPCEQCGVLICKTHRYHSRTGDWVCMRCAVCYACPRRGRRDVGRCAECSITVCRVHRYVDNHPLRGAATAAYCAVHAPPRADRVDYGPVLLLLACRAEDCPSCGAAATDCRSRSVHDARHCCDDCGHEVAFYEWDRKIWVKPTDGKPLYRSEFPPHRRRVLR